MSIAFVVVFVLAAFLGAEVIGRVPATLHTPLMSGTNAISGIVVVGALVAAAGAEAPFAKWVAVAAIVLAAMNAVGGFLVTDRMLEMFKPRDRPDAAP